jgi:HK97 family phage portal protein
MSLISRVKSLWGAEGSNRGPFSGQGENGGWHTLGPIEDGYQRNLEIPLNNGRQIPAAYASVMANARAVSQCPPQHRRKDGSGKTEIVEDSPAAAVFRNPNPYETFAQFILNMIAQQGFDGNAYALVTRDDVGRVLRLDRLDTGTCQPYIEEGELFYSVGSNPFIADGVQYLVPAREILHLRVLTPRHVLIGESPIKAAALAAGVNVALNRSQATFFSQMSRPSGVLSTDQMLSKDQLGSLREAWAQQSQKMAQGHVPILSGNLRFEAMGITSQDAQLMEAQRFSVEQIAMCYGVPLPVIGDLSQATLSNAETLVSLWLSISLGSLLENVEQSLSKTFELSANENINFDVAGLLRTDFLTRIDGLTKAVQGGLYTPNEARSKEGLHPVEDGDRCIVQQQMVPLGFSAEPVPDDEPAPAEEERSVVDIEQFRKYLNG